MFNNLEIVIVIIFRNNNNNNNGGWSEGWYLNVSQTKERGAQCIIGSSPPD